MKIAALADLHYARRGPLPERRGEAEGAVEGEADG